MWFRGLELVLLKLDRTSRFGPETSEPVSCPVWFSIWTESAFESIKPGTNRLGTGQPDVTRTGLEMKII